MCVSVCMCVFLCVRVHVYVLCAFVCVHVYVLGAFLCVHVCVRVCVCGHREASTSFRPVKHTRRSVNCLHN